MAMMALEPLIAGEGAAAGGGAAGGGLLGRLGGSVKQFGGQALTSKIAGGGGGHKGAEKPGGPGAVVHALTTPGMATQAAQEYGALLQPTQFGG